LEPAWDHQRVGGLLRVETDEAMGALPWLTRARDAIIRAERPRQAATSVDRHG
jgi:hypothetical protein